MRRGGSVLRALDARSSARDAATALEAPGVEAIAVCFLHSWANPDHELAVGELIVRACDPAALRVASRYDIVREYREYERTSTTVLNAYVGPRVSGVSRRARADCSTPAVSAATR